MIPTAPHPPPVPPRKQKLYCTARPHHLFRSLFDSKNKSGRIPLARWLHHRLLNLFGIGTNPGCAAVHRQLNDIIIFCWETVSRRCLSHSGHFFCKFSAMFFPLFPSAPALPHPFTIPPYPPLPPIKEKKVSLHPTKVKHTIANRLGPSVQQCNYKPAYSYSLVC